MTAAQLPPHAVRARHSPRSGALLLSRFKPGQSREANQLPRALVPSSCGPFNSQPLSSQVLGCPLGIFHANLAPEKRRKSVLLLLRRHPSRRILACAAPGDGSWKPSSPPLPSNPGIPSSHAAASPHTSVSPLTSSSSHTGSFPCSPSHTSLQPPLSTGLRPASGMGSATGGFVADSVLGHSSSTASLMTSARSQGGLLNQPPTAPSSVRGIRPPGVRGLRPPRGMASSGGAVIGSKKRKKNLLHRRRRREKDDGDEKGEGGESGEGEAGKFAEGDPTAGVPYPTTSVLGSEAGLMGDRPTHEALDRAILDSIPRCNPHADLAPAAGVSLREAGEWSTAASGAPADFPNGTSGAGALPTTGAASSDTDLRPGGAYESSDGSSNPTSIGRWEPATGGAARANPAAVQNGVTGLKGVAVANGVARLDAAAGQNGVPVLDVAAGSNGSAELNGAARMDAAAGSSGAATQNGASPLPVDGSTLTLREPNHTPNGFPRAQDASPSLWKEDEKGRRGEEDSRREAQERLGSDGRERLGSISGQKLGRGASGTNVGRVLGSDRVGQRWEELETSVGREETWGGESSGSDADEWVTGEGAELVHVFVSKAKSDKAFRRGNIKVVRADDSPLRMLGNVYHATLRLPPVPFALSIFAAPILLSLLFTALYLFDLGGLYLDESASAFFQHLQGTAKGASIGDAAAAALALDKGAWDPYLLFELFMFSLSLATGLEPTIAPSSVYTQSLANLNALSAQLLFVFLSGAVFTRLSQPSDPISAANVAIITPPIRDPVLNPSRSSSSKCRMLLMRYMIVGLDPCHLVDVRIQVTLIYDSHTHSGSYFRVKETLQLVKDEDFSQMYGFVVRHVIDRSSPLYGRTQEDLEAVDASLVLCVLGIEESSMQTVCHTEIYDFREKAIKWDAEFEDVLLETASHVRFVDERRLSKWRHTAGSPQ